MGSLILTTEKENDLKLLKLLAEKLGMAAHEISEDDKEDIGLYKTLMKGEKEEYVKEEDILEKGKKMKYKSINTDPEIMGGTSVFAGTRVPVQALFDYIETGETIEEFLENFPTVSREQAVEVLELARKLISTEKTLNENPA